MYSLAQSALTLIHEKVSRVDRRLGVLAKRKAESEFAMEMAFEEEMPHEELETMQVRHIVFLLISFEQTKKSTAVFTDKIYIYLFFHTF